MPRTATIALATIYHNRGLAVVLPAVLSLAGCSAASNGLSPVPTWELANAEPVKPTPVCRARLSYDRPLPAHLLQELCPEYSLVVIRTERDWMDVCRRLQCPSPNTNLDLTRGAIVGLVANVGESMVNHWPINLRTIRRTGTEGFLEAAFTPGLYYPLITASYVDLAYAPGIRSVSLVRIDNRRFIIRSVAAH